MLATRRDFLAFTGAAAAASLAAPQVLARAPFAGALTPSYRLKLGDFEITALADGYIDLDQSIFANADKSEAGTLLASAFRDASGPIRTVVNAFVVNTGDKLVLIDCGTIQGFSPTLAKLPERLKAQGFDPDAFDTVLLTHMHPDHVGAATDGQGAARFTKAELLVSEAEWKFWSDAGMASRAPKDMQPFFKIATDAARPYGKALQLFGGDKELVTGITPVALPGHTPGHTGFLIASGKESLLIWGDIVHSAALQFPHPEWSIALDVDQQQAAKTRRAIFERTASDRTLVAGMHLDFPGLGHVTRNGTTFGFAPASWRLDQ